METHFKEHSGQISKEPPDEVLSPQSYPHLKPMDLEDIEVDEGPPNQEEIEKSIKTLKNGKCKGSDELFAEQIKYNVSSTMLQIIFTLLMAIIWTTMNIPQTWLRGRVRTFHVVGCGFKPWPSHTKDLKNGTNYFLAAHTA